MSEEFYTKSDLRTAYDEGYESGYEDGFAVAEEEE